MVDVSLVPEAAWCEARRRAEVIRPLVESAHRSRHLVQAAAVTLGLSERQTYTILRRCRGRIGQPLAVTVATANTACSYESTTACRSRLAATTMIFK